LRCRPLVVPSATLLRISWRAEPCVHAMCVAQLLLSRASRECISLLPPRPACLYSFVYTRSRTSVGRRAPTLLRGDTLTVDGPGRSRLLPRCARVPAPSIHFDCCVYFLYSISRDPTNSVGHHTAPFRRDPHVHAREPSPSRLSAIRLESPRGASAHGDCDRKA
jgi:hypothetical protein